MSVGMERGRPLALAVVAALSGCMVGPDYLRPSAPAPAQYKEAEGWTVARPRAVASGAWWTIYDDPVLSDIEAQIAVSNQNLMQAEAAYREAQAVVKEAQAGLFPTVAADAAAARSRGGGGGGGAAPTGGSVGSETEYSLDGTASWAPDVWGRVRHTVEGDVALAQASADDVAAARLSAQTAAANDYFQLRGADQLKLLLDEVIAGYRESLRIAQNQYDAGTAARSDVITAETQLEGAQAQQVAVGVQRATLEHAIAVLVGKAPADFAIAPAPLATEVPVAPPGLPSTLLERRPDIAAAERQMASANAQIGVAVSAYYPDLNLTATGGLSALALGTLVSAPTTLWSLGAALSETVLDGGARGAAVEQTRALYDADVAAYRQTVLTGFQQVEDELATLRILEQQAQIEDRAVASAREAVRLTLNEYQAGTVAYTAVVSAQSTLVGDEQSALAILESRLVASVALIGATGGGWSAAADSAGR